MSIVMRRTLFGRRILQYECPNCGETYRLPFSAAGTVVDCKYCQYSFSVPGVQTLNDQQYSHWNEHRRPQPRRRTALYDELADDDESQVGPYDPPVDTRVRPAAANNDQGIASPGNNHLPPPHMDRNRRRGDAIHHVPPELSSPDQPLPTVEDTGDSHHTDIALQAFAKSIDEVSHHDDCSLAGNKILVSSGLIDYPFDTLAIVADHVVTDNFDIGCQRALDSLRRKAHALNGNCLIYVSFQANTRSAATSPHAGTAGPSIDVYATGTVAYAQFPG